LDAEDIVVDREHVEGRVSAGAGGNSNLRVINAGEVARAGRLVLLGLEREGVRVHTGHGGTGVVVEGLDGVEILGTLLLEPVLAVENELHVSHVRASIIGPSGGGRGGDNPGAVAKVVGDLSPRGCIDEGRTKLGVVRGDARLSGEVPHVVESLVSGGEAPHKLLDGVVERKPLLVRTGGEGISSSVLNLLNEVFVALLGKTPTLLSVEVDVIGVYLERAGGDVCRQLSS